MTLMLLGCSTLAKHHIQEFGLPRQPHSTCQPHWRAFSVRKRSRLFSEETLNHLNVNSCLISAILAVLLIATAPEEFGIPECTTTVEAADLAGPHRWGIILPNSSRVSLLTYKAIVAVRYPELVLHDQDPILPSTEDSARCYGKYPKTPETSWQLLRMS